MGKAKLTGFLVASVTCGCAEAPAPPPRAPTESRAEAPQPAAAEPAPPPAQAPPEPEAVCTGTAGAEDVARVQAGAAQTKQCYDQLLQSDRCATGKLRVLTQFEASGKASMSVVDGRGFTDPRFYACIESTMQKVQLAEHESCVRVVVPLSFVPKQAPEGCDGPATKAPLAPTAPAGACLADELVWLQPPSAPNLLSTCKIGDVPTCQEACDKDGTAACLTLAMSYEEGHGVTRDTPRAIDILERSCSGGYQTACGFLGSILAQGALGVPKDTGRAERLAQTACRAGGPIACETLAYLYLEKADSGSVECAKRLLQASCDADQVSACSRLAVAVAETDLDAAYRLFEKACRDGYEPACVRLAQTQLAGSDPALQRQAIDQLTTRCNADGYDACNALGYAFVRGAGVPEDPAKGVELFRKACVQQYPNGCDSLAEAYVNGWGVSADRATANEYYKKACDWGFGLSCGRIVNPKRPK